MPMSEMGGVLIREQEAGEGRALDPAALAAAHPSWARDVDALAPWDFDPGEGGWRSGAGAAGNVLVSGQCGSALDLAWELWDAGRLPEWGAVLAVRQTAGRGQLRRAWRSFPGNLHAAWAWPAPPPGFADLTPLAAGLLVAEALEQLGVRLSIKWPNDLLLDDRKVGGILVEERQGRTLVGLGLNLTSAPPAEFLREEWSQPAADLSCSGLTLGPLRLMLALEDFAIDWYALKVSRGNPALFPSLFAGRLAWVGRDVLVHGSGPPFTATLQGLLPDGGLSLVRDGRELALHAGSISARSADGLAGPHDL
ncbi:MAG: biotin--[acetyl-CoA-carboxylase] ligase [Thermodesulfobacteriota bacterium]